MQDSRLYRRMTTRDILCAKLCVHVRPTSPNDSLKNVCGNELGYEIIEINAAHDL